MVWSALVEHVFRGVGDRLVRQRGLENSAPSMKSTLHMAVQTNVFNCVYAVG